VKRTLTVNLALTLFRDDNSVRWLLEARHYSSLSTALALTANGCREIGEGFGKCHRVLRRLIAKLFVVRIGGDLTLNFGLLLVRNIRKRR
jgi:hypothetical protein